MRTKVLILFYVLPFCVFSQQFEISGKVKDNFNAPIPFANVLLLRASDSIFVKGTNADERGKFLLEDIEKGTYYIKASYIGLASELTAVDVFKNVGVGSIVIEESTQNLNEVVITGKKPVVQRKSDRLVFDVENSVLSQGSTWDILRHSPGVIANQNELQIRGQSATVYINNKKVNLSSEEIQQLLENYSGANIKSVEIIMNPPAQYDADGGPVLNIVSSKTVSIGYKSSVDVSYKQSVFPKYSLGTNHYFKSESVDFFAGYSYGTKKKNKNTIEDINFIDNTNTVFSVWDTEIDQVIDEDSHNAILNFDYKINDTNFLSFSSTAFYVPGMMETNSQSTNIINGFTSQLDSVFITNSGLNSDKVNFSGDLTYTLKTEKSEWNLNGHYTYYDFTRNQNVLSEYYDPFNVFMRDYRFNTESDQQIDIFTAQLDYKSSIGSVHIDAGVKGSMINSESGIDFYNINNGIPVLNPDNSDDFTYEETVLAGYVSFNKDWDNWGIKAGLRGENTISEGTSDLLGEINNLEYFELFPSVYINHQLSDKHSMAFDYSRKMQRPLYSDLNPFAYFINENNSREGNPELVPNFSHNFNFNYTFNDSYFLDVYYRDYGNYISSLIFQDNDNQTIVYSIQNLIDSSGYGVDIYHGSLLMNWWYFYGYVSVFHEEATFLATQSNDQQYSIDFDGVYLDLTNYLTLSSDGTFTGEVGFNYLSGYLSSSYIQEETMNLTVGLRKTFSNNRYVLSLTTNDLLGKANARTYSEYLNQDNAFLLDPESQYFLLGFKINFGNFRLSDNQRGIDKNERDRLD